MFRKLTLVFFKWSIKLYQRKIPYLPGMLRSIIFLMSSCDLSFRAKIGKHFRLAHPTGIVIGSGVVMGDQVWINQHVTLGGNLGKKKDGRAYPIIGSRVRILAGSVVAGPITIGDNVLIGANSVVTRDVPSNTVVAGNPAKIVRPIRESDLARLDEVLNRKK